MNATRKRSAKTSASDKPPREIELKLELASGTADTLLAHSALAGARFLPDQSGHLHAVYYDTDDQLLRRSGISLRIRQKGERSVQTVKAEQGERGLAMNRGEWETPVDGALDFAAIAQTPLGPLVSNASARDAFKPAFAIETERKAFESKQDGAIIEISLDRTVASAHGRSAGFSELELELKQGDPSALFTFARDLSATVPLRLALVPKSERGYRLLDDECPGPFRAETITLPKDASCAEAFRVIARNCLSQMVLNEALVRQTLNPAALHQMRVGLRRLRAAISLFKSQLLADEESTEIKEALRAAGQPLGEARDLDVLLERLQTADADSGPFDLEPLRRRREQAYKDLLAALKSPDFLGLILRTAAWIETGAWSLRLERGQKKARRRSARDFAADELSRRWKRIRKLAGHMRDIDDTERHKLRIRIKKLRYGAEFFSSLFLSTKAVRRRKKLSSALEDLQERLGRLNDLTVGNSLAPPLPGPTPKRIKKQRSKLLDKAERAAIGLGKSKPFWV